MFNKIGAYVQLNSKRYKRKENQDLSDSIETQVNLKLSQISYYKSIEHESPRHLTQLNA